MSAQPSITLGIVSHQRPDELLDAVASAAGHDLHEIIVVDSSSTPPLAPVPGTRHIRCEDNVGGGGGRNVIAREATSDLVFFLDDDAVLRPGTIEAVRKAFAADPALGAVATHLVRPEGEERIEQPYRAGFPIPSQSGPAGYFITAGCAVRRDAYESVGGSDARMTYGTDDIDLAFRLQQHDWQIRWVREALVEHRPSKRGRMVAGDLAGHHMRNRILLARTFLPLPIAAIHLLLWLGLTGRDALGARDVRAWARWVRRGFGEKVERRRMTHRQLVALHRRGGRVLY